MKKHYKDEIRKVLLFHSLVPFLIVLVFMILFMLGHGLHQAKAAGKTLRTKLSSDFLAMSERYGDKAESLASKLDPLLYQSDSSYRTHVNEEILHFLNQDDYKAVFYLIDTSQRVLYKSSSLISDREISSARNWISKGNSNFLYYYNSRENRTDLAFAYFAAIESDSKEKSFCGFLIPSDHFFSKNRDPRATVILYNQHGRVFSNGSSPFWNERHRIDSRLLQQQQQLCSFHHQWYLTETAAVLDRKVYAVSLVNIDSLLQLSSTSLLVGIILAMVIVAGIYISSAKVAQKSTSWVDELVGSLKRLEEGKLDVRLQLQSENEFELISRSFNNMADSIQHLIRRHQELAEENLTAKIQLLESQFDPHFIFNSLESIRYLIRLHPENAERMIVNLARLMRYSISNERDLVPLQEEMDFCKRYLDIMLYRYGKRLEYRIHVSKACSSCNIPRMLLQPIVENAIKYGFGSEKELLRIVIEVYQSAEMLNIKISDNGIGIDREVLKLLVGNLSSPHNKSGHIGFYNVNKRLQLIYGNSAGLRIDSQQGKGCEVLLSIPCDTSEEGKCCRF